MDFDQVTVGGDDFGLEQVEEPTKSGISQRQGQTVYCRLFVGV